MSLGAVLVGLAVLMVLVAYVARPFRAATDVDAQIEAWVAALGSVEIELGSQAAPDPAEVPLPTERVPKVETDVAFCHRCGRPVRAHHRYCPRCGADLAAEAL